MADRSREIVQYPFTLFNFSVEITLPGQREPLCSAAFSECDGLEMTMTPKTIREGGNNKRPIHLIGPVAYGQLSLKRGMTDTLDLWEWFRRVNQKGQHHVRASCNVVMWAQDGVTEQLSFVLKNCLPIKIKAPAFNAQDGIIAIEEMQVAYELLEFKTSGA